MTRCARVVTVSALALAVTAAYYYLVAYWWPGGTAGFVLALAFAIAYPRVVLRSFETWIDPPEAPAKEE